MLLLLAALYGHNRAPRCGATIGAPHKSTIVHTMTQHTLTTDKTDATSTQPSARNEPSAKAICPPAPKNVVLPICAARAATITSCLASGMCQGRHPGDRNTSTQSVRCGTTPNNLFMQSFECATRCQMGAQGSEKSRSSLSQPCLVRFQCRLRLATCKQA